MQSLTGLWIPLEYLQNQRLTGNERLILSFIRYKQAEEGFQGSNREIGTSLQLKDNRVSEAIVELIKKGFLERIDKNLKTSENWKHSENRKPENIPKNGNINSEKRKLPKSEPYISIQKPNEDDSTKDIQKKETKKKASKNKVELKNITFAESEYYNFKVFEDYLNELLPGLDINFYYQKIATWLDRETGNPAKRKIWKSTIKVFIENDYRREELVTKTKSHGKYTNHNPRRENIFEQTATATVLDELADEYLNDW
jgi:hypothetical protein